MISGMFGFYPLRHTADDEDTSRSRHRFGAMTNATSGVEEFPLMFA